MTFGPPGDQWKASSCRKANLLVALCKCLTAMGEAETAPTFSVMMELIGADSRDANCGFFDRVFIHLVALTLHREFCVEHVIPMVTSPCDDNLILVDQMSSADVPVLAASLKGNDGGKYDFMPLAGKLKALANAVAGLPGGVVPTDLQGLTGIGVDETVARLLMQQVFGSTEIFMGIDACKVVCALDMIDWEVLDDVEYRSDLKMNMFQGDHVKNSVQTWLPRGQGIELQQALEALGAAIGTNNGGFWGKQMAAIGQNFKGKDKKDLENVVTEILRFYKFAKCGVRKRCSL